MSGRFRVFGGAGTRVFSAGKMLSVSATQRSRWAHAWKCNLAGNRLTVRLGLVNGLEPFIAGKLMGGKDLDGVAYPTGIPFLTLDAKAFDETGRSYIALRARVNANGRINEKNYTAKDLYITQSAVRNLSTGDEGQHVIAVLRRPVSESGFGALRQLAFFDYQHGVSGDAGKFRHWFLPG